MTTPGGDNRGRTGSRARAIVDHLADRLADPAAVAARTAAGGNVPAHADDSRQTLWSPLSLGDGYPGLALLYAELGHVDASYRRVAHGCLGQAVAHLTSVAPGGLFAGSVALAFAAVCAARRPTEYANLLEPLDRGIAAWLPARLRDEWARIEAGRPGTRFAHYDVVTGVTGVGRYLLRRTGAESRSALTGILSYLVALSRPCPAPDGPPGWFVAHRVDGTAPSGDGSGGHLNAGLAHGIPGPLALLALAWQEGVRVAGQDEAIARIADWLLDRRITDPDGTTWPATADDGGPDVGGRPCPARDAWCYGAPGVARALQLAGQALGRPEWPAAAVDAVAAMLARPAGPRGVTDPGLCHGWAGLLHLVRLVGLDSGDPRIVGAATGLAARVVDRYEHQAPFGFRASWPPTFEPVDLPGFLEGSAGVALALLSYLDDGRPVTGWDTALLIR